MHSLTHRILQSTWPKKKLFPLCRTCGGYSKDAYDACNFSNVPDYSTLKAARFVPFWGGGHVLCIDLVKHLKYDSVGMFKTDYFKVGASSYTPPFVHNWSLTHIHPTKKENINNYPKSPDPSKLPIEDPKTPLRHTGWLTLPLEGPITKSLG